MEVTLDDLVPLTRLSHELHKAYPGAEPPGRWPLYKLIVDGKIESERDGREHTVSRSQFPKIARLLGLPSGDRAAA